MNEVHRPDKVGANSYGAVIAQLRLHSPLRCLVPQLHPKLLVNAIDHLDVGAPAFTIKKDVNAPVSIPNPSFTYLPDPLGDGSLIATAGLVVERRAVEPDGPTKRLADACFNDIVLTRC